MENSHDHSPLAMRFRGFFPVVIDVETGGFNPKTDALLEIAAVTLSMNKEGLIYHSHTYAYHVLPFEGANLDPEALKFTGIDPYHPFRFAVKETEALLELFRIIRSEMKQAQCSRAILVGHNAPFDLSFLQAATLRSKLKRNPFHPFSTIDTVGLSALALGQTVLAKAVRTANINFDHNQAHSAIYDAERTAELFCYIVNRWQRLGGWDGNKNKPNV
jgi:ribonuclease T